MIKPLRLAKHEKFAQQIAAGETQAAAYRAAYRYTGPERGARRLGYRLSIREDIRSRVAHLQQRSASRVNWSLEDRLTFLRDVVLTPPCEITAASPLCLGTRLTAHGVELKLIDKARAIELYSRLSGDLQDKPEPVTATPLGEIMDRIRSRSQPTA